MSNTTILDAAALAEQFGSLSGVTPALQPAPELAIAGFAPLLCLCPADETAVAAVLRSADSLRLGVLPHGGMTMLGVATGLRAPLALDLRALYGVTDYRPRDLTVTVAAGTPWQELADTVAAHGQVVGLDPPLPERATVGGVLAANASGPWRRRYGTARDQTIGSRAVTAGGEVLGFGGRVIKDVAGYDLTKLLIGSLGTLAVLTQATFRLQPAPVARVLVTAALATPESACAVAAEVAGSSLTPFAVDVAGPGVLENQGDAPWTVAVDLGGGPATLARMRGETVARARTAGAGALESLDGAARAGVYAALRDFGRPAGQDTGLLLRASALPSRLPALLRACAETAAAYGMTARLLARAANGTVYFHAPEVGTDSESALVTALRARVAALDGFVVVERRTVSAGDEIAELDLTGSDVPLMRRLKAAFDPNDILNPGRGPAGP